jgi:hypothetical protein
MLRDPPVVAYVLRDWLLCRKKPLRALPAYLWRPPRLASGDAETPAPGAAAVFARALWGAASNEAGGGAAGTVDEEEDEAEGGDGGGVAYGEESEDGDDEEHEDSHRRGDGLGRGSRSMPPARKRALARFVAWASQAGHLLPALAALPPALRFGAVEECSGMLGHGASDAGIQTTVLHALFDLKANRRAPIVDPPPPPPPISFFVYTIA